MNEHKNTDRRYREIYHTVLESSPDPIVVYDMDGCATYVNSAFTKVFGWTRTELIGRRIDFVPEESWPETHEMIGKVVAGERFSGYETRRYTKDGRIIDVSVSGSTFSDDQGSPQGSIINLRDITEKKQLEAKLFQAHKLEAVGTLAGGIAHDFNNILQAISGYTQLLLLDTEKENPAYDTLAAIERAAERASELTRQLLIFGRRVESELRPVDLNREVVQVARILERAIPKMITIERRLAEDLRPIDADPVQLEQIMMNIGVNARDAMEQGGTLRFETQNISLDREGLKSHRLSTPGDYVLLRISDTGHGMEKDTRDRIFEPFFTTRAPGKGTGLGLAMVYGIVQSHGGDIVCTSQPGEGAVFDIYFPAHTTEKKPASPKTAATRMTRGRETVLLVDDERSLLDIGTSILKRFGYQVLTAESGEQALALYGAQKGGIDLVILDISMPGMGGHRCLQALLALDPDARVIVASGYASGGYETEATAAGAAGFIGKPFKLSEMLNKVRAVLDARPAPSQTPDR